jgi:hypothetical protein
MHALLAKVDTIALETSDGPQPRGGAAAASADHFKSLKAQIASNLRETRVLLKERDELLGRGAGGTRHNIQLSHRIRAQLRDARQDAAKLQSIQAKEAARLNKQGTEGRQKAQERLEMVALVFQHLDECDGLEKRRYTSKFTEARIDLFSGGRTQIAALPSTSRTAITPETALPDLETQAELDHLEAGDRQIDQGLQVVAEGVRDLRTIAVDMRDEMTLQRTMMNDIEGKVDKANVKLNNVNRRMKRALVKTRSADRFILDFILIVVLLGIVGFIIMLVV